MAPLSWLERLAASWRGELRPTSAASIAPAGASSPKTGTVVNGRFTLRAPLGQQRANGGVWRADDGLLQSSSVVTLLWADDRHDREALTRALAALPRHTHPHLLAVRDAGLITEGALSDWACVAVDGFEESLHDRKSGAASLSVDETHRLAIHICEALAGLHERGEVQGGLMPSDIVRAGNDWKLRHLQGIRGGTWSELPGESGGAHAVAFVAPEALGAVAYAPSDLWALGAIVQWCATGALPHDGEDVISCVTALMTTEPRISDALPSRLESFVRRSLVTDPAMRLTAAEGLELLGRAT